MENNMTTGARFTKWGLGLFIFGIFLNLGPIGHYCIGANHDNGATFMHNITLWWGCPWTLSVFFVQIGGLGMLALGLTQLFIDRSSPVSAPTGNYLAFLLCVMGVLGVFLVGFPGYFVYDRIWPSFYYLPVPTGKNAWLLGQGLFILVYLCGAVMAFDSERRALNAISA
jgi:hypothetical protein